jgi:signal transduction histidine kinase
VSERASDSFLLTPELHNRLLWFIKLRWLAVGGLALGSQLAPRLGYPAAWAHLGWVALAVLAYNLYFRLVPLRHAGVALPYDKLHANAILQMAVDLAALLVTVHYTGGLQSPLLPFFVFHMAIGTIMVEAGIMYLIAFGTCWSALCLFILEAKGVVEYFPVDALQPMSGRVSGVSMLSLVIAVFGTVYLTDSVARQFRRRTVQLHERTEELASQEERKSRFMLLSAHQLRSPLATVRTSLAVMLQGFVEPSSARGRKLLDGAAERVDGLLQHRQRPARGWASCARAQARRGSPTSSSTGARRRRRSLRPLAAGRAIDLRPGSTASPCCPGGSLRISRSRSRTWCTTRSSTRTTAARCRCGWR